MPALILLILSTVCFTGEGIFEISKQCGFSGLISVLLGTESDKSVLCSELLNVVTGKYAGSVFSRFQHAEAETYMLCPIGLHFFIILLYPSLFLCFHLLFHL